MKLDITHPFVAETCEYIYRLHRRCIQIAQRSTSLSPPRKDLRLRHPEWRQISAWFRALEEPLAFERSTFKSVGLQYGKEGHSLS